MNLLFVWNAERRLIKRRDILCKKQDSAYVNKPEKRRFGGLTIKLLACLSALLILVSAAFFVSVHFDIINVSLSRKKPSHTEKPVSAAQETTQNSDSGSDSTDFSSEANQSENEDILVNADSDLPTEVNADSDLDLPTEVNSNPPITVNPNLPVRESPKLPVKQKNRDIYLSASLQYDLNIFLSNFSEQRMNSFNCFDLSDEMLVNYALCYHLFNKFDCIEFGDFSAITGFGGSNVRLSESRVISCIDKYFGIKKAPGFFAGKGSGDWGLYKDGYIYMGVFTGAPICSDGFSVVKRVYPINVSETRYRAEFDIYKVNSADYCTEYEDEKQFYAISSAKAKDYFNQGVLLYCGSGEADIIATGLSDRSTYKLDGYNVGRTAGYLYNN